MTTTTALSRLAQQGVFVGTCSWTDPTLVEAGTFYPARGHDPGDRLAYYAAQFPIVEVDATYYAPPAERTAGLWVERTPPDFTFDVKAFRLLTEHPTPPRSLWKDLAAALPDELKAKKNLYARDLPRELLAEAFGRFVSALLPLHSAGKLGVVLFQLPPVRAALPRRLRLPVVGGGAPRRVPGGGRVPPGALDGRSPPGVDPRFPGGAPPVLRLRGRPAGVPLLDAARWRGHRRPGRGALPRAQPETWEAPGIGAAERFRYHYPAAELQEWAPRVKALAEQAGRSHVLMNNCYADYGVKGARQLAMLLEQSW